MTGYTRQSTANIVAGQPVNASPLAAEFNAIEAAYHGSTGHAHDGTSGSGPRINLTTSVTGILPVANGGTGLSTLETLTLTSTDAGATETPSLILYRNSASPAVNDLIGRVLWQAEDSAGNTDDAIQIHGRIDDPTSTSEDYSLIFQTKTAGSMTTGLTLTGLSLHIPSTGIINWNAGDVTLTHSANTLTWAGGTTYVFDTDLRVTTAGTNTASVVTVGGTQTLTSKTLTSPVITTSPTAAGATWTDLGTVTTADINGGTIDNTAIGATTRSTGAFTTLAANSTVTFTAGGSMTGTWSDLGAVTTVDINGGTIDGSVIGGASAAAGTFTTITGTDLTLSDSTPTITLIDSDIGADNTITVNGTTGGITFSADVNNEVANSNFLFVIDGTNHSQMVSTAYRPVTNDGLSLGVSGTAWSDLFLASGAVIDFAAGNSVITHSSGILTVSTGDLRVTTAGTNTASVVTVGGTQTLTNKTLTSPTINTPTLTLTNSAGPTPTAEGRVEWDSDEDVFRVGNGSTTKQIGEVFSTQASTSGTAITFSSIPASVNRIIVSFQNVSTNGTNIILLRIGDSGGVESAGYGQIHTRLTTGANTQNAGAGAWSLISSTAATGLYSGTFILTKISTDGLTWSGSGTFGEVGGGTANFVVAGHKTLSAQLDRVEISASGDTFDSGNISIIYE